MAKYLVLGSSGFIGKSLCKYLRTKHEVVEFDIQNSEEEDLRKHNNLKLINHIASCDFVFFLAFDIGGSKYLARCNKDYTFLINNIQIISNAFEVLKKAEIKFIFVSSYLAENKDHSYGILKKIGEHFTSSLGGLVVRLYNVFGNEDVSYKSHVIPDLIYQARTQKCIKLNTKGTEERQFLYIEDCCEGLYVISQNYFELLTHNSNIDLSSFEWISIKNIAEIIGRILGCGVEYSKNRAEFLVKVNPNKLVLDYWYPKTSVEEGIIKLINEY